MRSADQLRGRRGRPHTSATRSRPHPPPQHPPPLLKDAPTGRPHPGSRGSGGRRGRSLRGRGLPWLAASRALSPPRGQVRPSRDAPRLGRSGLQRVSGAEAAAVEFAARGWGPPCLFARVRLSIVALESRWAAPGLDMSYNYVVTAQKPTAVNGCVTGEAATARDPGGGGSWSGGEPRPREARGPRAASRTRPGEWKALAAEKPPPAPDSKEGVSSRAVRVGGGG